jgi:hypothetical protein
MLLIWIGKQCLMDIVWLNSVIKVNFNQVCKHLSNSSLAVFRESTCANVIGYRLPKWNVMWPWMLRLYFPWTNCRSSPVVPRSSFLRCVTDLTVRSRFHLDNASSCQRANLICHHLVNKKSCGHGSIWVQYFHCRAAIPVPLIWPFPLLSV